MKNQRKNQKGITLIALVITIIVLLILAGVTLSIVFNGGIINKSQTAVDKYSEESAKEKLSLAIFNYKMGVITGEAGEGEGQKTFDEYIAEIGGEITVEITVEDDTTYTIEVDGYEFIVGNKNYEITSNGPANAPKPTIKLVGDPVLSTDKKKVTLTIEAKAANGGNLTVTVDGKPATLSGNVYLYEVTTNGNHTIKAKETNGKTESLIVNVTGIEVTKYTVTINTGTGIESVTQTSEQVEKDQSIEITATAQTGYTFSKWKVTSGNESDVASLTSATTTVTPTGNITIEATAEEKVEYNIGDEVTIGEEHFYVLEKNYENDETVTLITKYNLNTAGTAQVPDAAYGDTDCAFSSKNYWSSISGITYPYDLNSTKTSANTDAIAKAKAYAKTVTGDNTNNTGRLLTYNEATELKTLASSNNNVATMLWGKENQQGSGSSSYYLYYWLGSAIGTDSVWSVSGNDEDLTSGIFGHNGYFGVRPVITVSKSSDLSE